MQEFVKKLNQIPLYMILFALNCLLACEKKNLPIATIESMQETSNLGSIHRNITTKNTNNEDETTKKINIDKKSLSKEYTFSKKTLQTDILSSKLGNQKRNSSITKKTLKNSVENIDVLSTDKLKVSKQVIVPKKIKIASTKRRFIEDSDGNKKKLSNLAQMDYTLLEDCIFLDNHSLLLEKNVESKKNIEQKVLESQLENFKKNIELLDKEIRAYQKEIKTLQERSSMEKAPKKDLKEIKDRLIKEDLIGSIINQQKIKKGTQKEVIEIIIAELNNRRITLSLARKSLQDLVTSKKEADKKQNELESNINIFHTTKLKYNKIRDCISLFTK